jgi:hypothetical protein
LNILLESSSMNNQSHAENISPSTSLVKPEEVGILLVVLAIYGCGHVCSFI